MKHLLDTHIWIWTYAAPEKLSAAVVSALRNPANELLLSPVSIWEFLTLVRKRRVVIEGTGEDWVRDCLSISPIHEVALSGPIVFASERLGMPHWDPADRFIAATASVTGATLVTADRKLIDAGVVPTLVNG